MRYCKRVPRIKCIFFHKSITKQRKLKIVELSLKLKKLHKISQKICVCLCESVENEEIKGKINSNKTLVKMAYSVN